MTSGRDHRPPGRTRPACARKQAFAPPRGLAATLVALVSGIVASLWFVSCTVDRDVLRIFFDGVPDENAPEPVKGPGLRGPLTLEERSEYQKKHVVQAQVYYHTPWREQRCGACHIMARQSTTGTTWALGIQQLIEPIETLCSRCHRVAAGRSAHGPAVTGQCALCHLHHTSRFPNLVRVEQHSTICRTCHVDGTFATREKHRMWEAQECTECHDPHASPHEDLLHPKEGEPEFAAIITEEPGG